MFAPIHFGILGAVFALVTAPLIILACIFWIWMLVHAITNRGLGDAEKIAWVVAIVFLHFLGAALYFLFGRPKRWSSFPG